MKITLLLSIVCNFLIPNFALSQSEFIYSTEGEIISNSRTFFNNCINSYKIDGKLGDAPAICRCQLENINRKFTNKQFKNFTKNGLIDLSGLIETNIKVKQKIDECLTKTGKTVLVQTENHTGRFIKACVDNMKSVADSLGLSEQKLVEYCTCRANLISNNNYSDENLEKLSSVNSEIYYVFQSSCGKYLEKEEYRKYGIQNIVGPSADTISFINLRGMSYLNVKLSVFDDLYWLLDTGASDLLINLEMEEILKANGVLNDENFTGIRDYELANGTKEKCRSYVGDNIRIGDFTLNNVSISVSETGQKILVGRSLLNKFSTITLDNKLNKIYLTK